MKQFSLSLMVLCMAQLALAHHTPQHTLQQKIQAAAEQYQVKKQLNQMIVGKAQGVVALTQFNCPPNTVSSSCVDSVCAKVGSSDCDDLDEINVVAGICKGNFNGECVDAVCAKVGSSDCDDLDEVTVVGNACKGNFNGACVDTVCSKVGSSDCDDLDEIAVVGKACKGADADCIESVCSKVGSSDCDDLDEIKIVAESCSPFEN
jgi:hypothetical protein